MRAKSGAETVSNSDAQARGEIATACVRRRTYNREYMRTWRSDPRHRQRERVTRQKAYYARKLRDAIEYEMRVAASTDNPVCGFCGKLPPVTEVIRLRIREDTDGAYVPVRIPYCGQC